MLIAKENEKWLCIELCILIRLNQELRIYFDQVSTRAGLGTYLITEILQDIAFPSELFKKWYMVIIFLVYEISILNIGKAGIVEKQTSQ